DLSWFDSPHWEFPAAATFDSVSAFGGEGSVEASLGLAGTAEGDAGVAEFQTFLDDTTVWKDLAIALSPKLATGVTSVTSMDGVEADEDGPEQQAALGPRLGGRVGFLLLLGAALVAIAQRARRRRRKVPTSCR